MSKNKKNVKKFLLKIFNFYNFRKNRYITWACFRNVFFTEHEGFILYSKVTGMESINLKNEDMPNAPVEPFTNDTHLRNVVGLSFDYSKKRIFFSDIQRGDIQFVNFDKTNYTTIIEGE